MDDRVREQAGEANESFTQTLNPFGAQFLKNLALDQELIWRSPAHLHWADGNWLFPLAAVTGGLFATDRAAAASISSDPSKLNRYTSFSSYAAYSLVGVSGGFYLWGKLSRDDHRTETGMLAGEAAIDGLAVDTALKYSFGRLRPDQGQGLGNFFQGGASFPSDHSAVAWSIASVIAHEYPGPLTEVAVYGLATAVSATRVMGKQHFPSDVFVGAAIGWLVGREVYRVHHDPDLGGGGWGPLSGMLGGEEERDRHNMGSTFVPLDSWVYPAIERLAGLRLIHTEIMGIKPWTRIECARLIEEAGEALQQDQSLNFNEDAARTQARLAAEFAYEIALLGGGRNLTSNLDSVYARGVSVNGPPLTDSYHFGETVAYDFGRPFERGTNGQVGGSFSAAAGPLAIYVRAEFQHAPSAPALSPEVRNFIAAGDVVSLSQVREGPIAEINRVTLLDAYVTANLGNWQLVLGNQSFSWAPDTDSLMWSNNAEPVHMVRLVNPEPFELPGFMRIIGPVRIDQFFGRLEGHPYVPRPFVYGEKINVKPFPWLELGFGRRSVIGGVGGDPLTALDFYHNFFGTQPVVNSVRLSVPGDTESEMDWTFHVPKVRNYIVLYGDAYAEDDILPVERPARNPWHPGIYITRIPGIPKLDFHMEGVSTEQDGAVGHNNFGIFNYYNTHYPDGNTQGGSLIGNTVGRDGRAIQAWFTYWFSAQDTLQFKYQHNTVSADFIPGGGAWQDYSARNEMHVGSGFYVKSELQVEHISRYPILFNGPQNNVTAMLEVGFTLERRK